ncbi:MAG: hypothetical protein HKP09_06720, partial [Enterobacterales bacterium]|nr:hypothetical protein [Enterobacterales bacterium]
DNVAQRLTATGQVNMERVVEYWQTPESMSDSASALHERQLNWTRYLLGDDAT